MARGFFSKEQIVSAPDCSKCKLDKGCKSPRMPVSGQGAKRVLIIGEAPGATEDLMNTEFVGDSGEFLRSEVETLGYDFDRDFWRMNAISCRPPDNRTPTESEIVWCRVNVTNAIQRLRPEHILLLGGTATSSFWKGDPRQSSISVWRGRSIPDYDIANAWVHPMFHPSYVLRKMRESHSALNIFRKDLASALSFLGQGLPERYRPEKQVTCLYNLDDVTAVLKSILETNPQALAFDYETSGLKPFRAGHRIDTVAVSNGVWCYSFPLMRPGHFDDQKEILRLWKRILLHPHIGLIAHNLKFEDMWTRVVLGCQPSHWLWDTMTVQHLLDEQQGTKSLKWQGYVRWGLPDWDSELKGYIRAVGSHDFNKVHTAPLDKLLEYNGIDAVTTYRLWEEQKVEVVEQKQEFMVDFYMDALEVLSDMTCHGIPVDEQYYRNQESDIERKVKEQVEKLYEDTGVQKYKEIKRVFPDFNKDDQVRYLMFDVLGYPRVKETAGGSDAIDKEVLGVIGTSLAEGILHYRRLQKVKSTYIGQFLREVVDGRINPFFELHVARSGRSSSERPNFQNIPNRTEESARSSRSGVFPLPGHKLVEIDYGSQEVRVLAITSQDPVLMNYVSDPSKDMHRDQAMDIFSLPQGEITKDLRFHGKNGFVFAEFYGSWYKSCAKSLYDACWSLKTKSGVLISDHMANCGIKNYGDFENHIRDVEERFWKKFAVTREWQMNQVAFHEENGYVENLFGFRRRGVLSRNEIFNTPIQGSGTHFLLWSLIQINKARKEERWKSVLLGQIHDCIILSVSPEEEKHVIHTCHRVITQDIREAFPWVSVPLEVEVEVTEVDGSWYTKKSVKLEKYLEVAA